MRRFFLILMLQVSVLPFREECFSHSSNPFWMMFEIDLLVKVDVISELDGFIKHIDEYWTRSL